MKIPLSVVIIAHNEEARIGNCLSSVQWAQDLLVVIDPETKDKTAEIAKSLGARVLVEPWKGFGPQKNFATRQAKHDWVLSLDADEEASPQVSAEIQSKFSGLEKETAYRIPRKSFHLGRWIRFGGWSPDYQTRLFHRQFSGWNQDAIHEKVEAKTLAKLDHSLLHYLFENLADQINTNNRYSSLLALRDFQSGKKFSLLKLLFKPGIKFIETYVWKMGFRDGLAGFIIAVGAGYSIFLRQAKNLGNFKKRSRCEVLTKFTDQFLPAQNSWAQLKPTPTPVPAALQKKKNFQKALLRAKRGMTPKVPRFPKRKPRN